MAVETGAEVLGHAIGDSAIQNRELTAEQLAASAGIGALVGGGLGVTMGLGGKLYRGTRSKIANAMTKSSDGDLDRAAAGMFGEASPGIGRSVSDIYGKVSSLVSGADEGAVKALSALDKGGREARRIAVYDAKDIRERLTGSMTESLDDTLRALDATKIAANSPLKKEQIQKLLKRGNEVDQLGAAKAYYTEAKDTLRSIIDDPDAHWVTGKVKKLEKRILRAEQDLLKAADSGKLEGAQFTHLDRLKSQLDGVVNDASKAAIRGDHLASITGNRLKGVSNKIRSTLEDGKLWGEAADMQRAINKAWSDKLSGPQQHFRADFLSSRGFGRSPLDEFRAADVADSSKVGSYLDNLTNPDKSLSHKAFNAWLDSTESYAKAGKKYLDIGPKEKAALDKILRNVELMRGNADEAASAMTKANQLKAITESEGQGALGMMIGGGLLGSQIGEGDSTAALGGAAAGAFLRPGGMIRRMAAIERLTKQMKRKVGSGLTKAFSHATKKPTGVRVGGAMIRTHGRKQDQKRQIEQERREQILRTTQENPAAHQAEVQGAFGQLGGAAPETARLAAEAALRGPRYLLDQMPQREKTTVFGEKPAYSNSELEHLEMLSRTVAKPTSILDDMSNGTLSTAQVEAVKATYPVWLEDIQRQAAERAFDLAETGRELPYQEQLQLAVLLEQPTNPMLEPDMMALIQGSYSQGPAQPPKKTQKRGAKMEMSDDLASGSDEIEGGAL
jgi:hypothetical protein